MEIELVKISALVNIGVGIFGVIYFGIFRHYEENLQNAKDREMYLKTLHHPAFEGGYLKTLQSGLDLVDRFFGARVTPEWLRTIPRTRLEITTPLQTKTHPYNI